MAKVLKPNLEGQIAPDFSVLNQNNQVINLSKLITKNKYTILYFYPKDMTSGCTTESVGFSKLKKNFAKFGAKVYGISKDSVKRHCMFIAKENLTIDLLSNESLKMLTDYGVWIEKSMYGRNYMGISRETVVIDSTGKIIKHWQKVKTVIHPAEVLEFIENL